MSLEKKKSTILGFLADLIVIPFMAIGQWVIAGLSHFNIIVIAFDFSSNFRSGRFHPKDGLRINSLDRRMA